MGGQAKSIDPDVVYRVLVVLAGFRTHAKPAVGNNNQNGFDNDRCG
jgi:hypothetical protein